MTTFYNKNDQMSTVLQTFASQTGFHGVSKVIVTQSPVRRCIWATICFVLGVVAVVQIAEVVRRYADYPKHISVELVADEPFPFPSVSVCHMRNLDFHVLNTINRMFNENEPSHFVNSNENQFVREYMKMAAAFQALADKYQGRHEFRDAFNELYSRMTLSANIPAHILSPAGIQLSEFVASCIFNGEQCNLTADVTPFFDPYFYNCYTYTAPPSGEMPAEGIDNGWSAVFLIGNGLMDWYDDVQLIPGLHESHSAVAASEGVRVVIHPPDTPPFPLTEGFDVPPGFSASLGVRPRRNIRIGQPHGKCRRTNPFDLKPPAAADDSDWTDNDVDQSSTGAETINGFGDINRSSRRHRYRGITCHKMCLQSHVVAQCGCYDTSLPILPELRRYKRPSLDNGDDEVKPCRLSEELGDICMGNATDECLAAVMTMYNRIQCARRTRDMVTRDTTLMAQCGCHPPCDEFQYDVSYSLSKWPATGFEGDSAFFEIFHVQKFPERFNVDGSSGEKFASVERYFSDETRRQSMKDFARLNVYIAGERGVIVTRERAEFEVSRLVSELGGQLAIWIGVSIVTLLEVIELIVLLAHNRLTSKRRASYDPSSSLSMTDSALCSATSTLQHAP